MGKALVIEDDSSIRGELVELLNELGLSVDEAESLRAALAAGERTAYRLVLVDLRLTDGTGFDALMHFQRSSDPPALVVVSSAMDVAARNRSIELGARDFISKPFHHEEAARRLQRALERGGSPTTAASAEQCVTVGPVELNLREHRVTNGPRQRRLSEAEARLLELIMRRAGRDVALDEVAGRLRPDDPHGPRTVRTLLRRLVRKVETRPRTPVWIRLTDNRLVRFATPAEVHHAGD